ncbi:hypothetical protein [Cognatazoarcus halotolerans]|uniref:hypothetical protein n=1 Tax=Cognatazoarcus halotolerans TaxID=2686016 RepID=UPI001356F397|nr:hypothetical protein [Cognatazoarcus halotolerans]MCB1901721.1 hypothetical protein [Rhodocyclaceae bacterium]MCP5308928.1 hypothetical protein [Zoogloeaceae bacterium]
MNEKNRFHLPEKEKTLRIARLRERFEQAHPMKPGRVRKGLPASIWKTLWFFTALLLIAWATGIRW